MRTITLRACGRAVATLLALLALPHPPAAADPPGDRIFEGRLEAGYLAADGEDDRSLLLPYHPLSDGPILGLDLLYLTPGFGTLTLEAGYLAPESWQAQAAFNHGSDVSAAVRSTASTHARQHAGPVPSVSVVTPPPAGMEVEGSDADPGQAYRDERRESAAQVKVRVPGYPAHLSASGRLVDLRGERQMRYFFRSCSNHLCHMDSRTRGLDQQTREYALGLDAHVGPVDLAYTHRALTFRDDAPDPAVEVGTMIGGSDAGTYPHDVNPDQRSAVDSLTLNTTLSNRVVLSLAASAGEQENQTSDLSRRTGSAGASLSWRLGASSLLVARYAYDEERTGTLGPEAAKLRRDRNSAQAAGLHQHAVFPERTRHTGEVSARFAPLKGLDLDASLRHRTLERYEILKKEGSAFRDESTTTRSTLAGLKGRYRIGPALSLDASLGREWTDDPVYAVESTSLLRYGLGASWVPARAFSLHASWQAFRGENDEARSLEMAYAGAPAGSGNPVRTVRGDAFLAAATYAPGPSFSLTLSWSLADNSIEQDMLFGNPANPGFSYLSSDTAWDGRAQTASLDARWRVTRRVVLTAGGLWIDSLESYAPTFPEGDGLEEAGRGEFTKLLGSLGAEWQATDAVALRLEGFWVRLDDQADDAGDGSARGVLASVGYRW